MSREIKLRIWSKSQNKYMDRPQRFAWAINDGLTMEMYIPQDLDGIFEEYTGLKDKNGKEIYEGDVLKFCNDKELASIVWDIPNAEFHIKWLECGVSNGLSWHLHDHGGAEVIGTIHENPELLEVSNALPTI